MQGSDAFDFEERQTLEQSFVADAFIDWLHESESNLRKEIQNLPWAKDNHIMISDTTISLFPRSTDSSNKNLLSLWNISAKLLSLTLSNFRKTWSASNPLL